MAKITKEEFHNILTKPAKDCDGYDLHVRNLWYNKEYSRLFQSTGLLFETSSDLDYYRLFVEQVQNMQEENREERRMIITFHTKEGWDQFHRAMEEEVERRFGKSKKQ